MVIGPDFVYVGLPRTASNTMQRLFLPQFGGVFDGKDHNCIIPVEHAHKFTFTVVRDPYTRMLSAWLHNLEHSQDEQVRNLSFSQFMRRLMSGDWPDGAGANQVQMLSCCRIDRHLRYERLADEVLDLPFNVSRIPWPTEKLNATMCVSGLRITLSELSAVNAHSAADFEAFGYRMR